MQAKFYPKDNKAKLLSTLFARITYYYNSLKLYNDLRVHPGKWDIKNKRTKSTLIGLPEFTHSKLKNIILKAVTNHLLKYHQTFRLSHEKNFSIRGMAKC